MKRTACVALVALGWLLCASPISANVILVPGHQLTIQAGINTANSGDTVLVAPNTYTENIDFLGKGIKVIGAAGSAVTELEPANASQSTVLMTAGEGAGAQLSGFTLSGGAGPSVIEIAGGAAPVIRDNIIRDFFSYVQNAVCIRCYDSDPTIAYNLFFNNTSIGCVGIFSGTANILSNTFDDNTRGFWSISGSGIAKNNIVTNSAEFGVARTFTVQDYNCIWGNNPDYDQGAVAGPNAVQAPPLYCNRVARDYSLSSISPCLAAGEGGVDMGVLGEGCGEPDPEAPSVRDLTIGGTDSWHVVDHTPDFSWGYTDPQSRPQAEAELEVGTDNDWTVAELWQPPAFAGTDTSVEYAGAALDDGMIGWVRVRVSNGFVWSTWVSASFRMNSMPTAPVPVAPIGQETIPSACTDLTLANSSDPDNDPLQYDFEIYADAGLTVLFASDTAVMEQPATSVSRMFSGFAPFTEYWWRCRADDRFETSAWSGTVSFLTSVSSLVIRVPADVPTIQAGIDATTCNGDLVLVAPGTYTENINFQGKSIRVVGEAGAEVTVLEPANPSISTVLIVSGEGPETELSGFTLSGGSGPSMVEVANSSVPLIQDNIFRDFLSYAPNAVAIGCHSSDPLITNNLFCNNISIGCVGILSGTARIIHNTFDRNTRGFWTISGSGIGKNNIVTNSTEFGIAIQFGSPEYLTELDYNCVWGNNPDYDLAALPGPNAISANPLYCGPGSGNYTLANTSPCLGTGEGGTDIGARGEGCDADDLNSVRVTSQTVAAGAVGVMIPIFVDNAITMSALEIPLVIREVTPGSYITSLTLLYGDRLPEDGPLNDAVVKKTYPDQDGTCALGGFGTSGLPDFISPDGALFQRVKIFSDPLLPGYDATGSLILAVSVTDVPGSFEIDTACADPNHHILYIEEGTRSVHTPKFTKGIVTIEPAEPSGPNHVIVDSKTVNMGASSAIGVSLANDVPLRGFVVPLVVRELTPGVYPTSLIAAYPPGSRLDGYLTEVVALDEYDHENGTCRFGQAGGFGTVGVIGQTSPDAFEFTRLRILGDDWPAGTDGATPSMEIAFTAPLVAGFFEIDTTCTDPASHLTFVTSSGLPVAGVTFTKGVVGVSPCSCPRQSDFDEDGYVTALDLASLIDVLFAGSPDIQDMTCPVPRGDFDCDDFSTALDLSGLIDYMFASGAAPCQPCEM